MSKKNFISRGQYVNGSQPPNLCLLLDKDSDIDKLSKGANLRMIVYQTLEGIKTEVGYALVSARRRDIPSFESSCSKLSSVSGEDYQFQIRISYRDYQTLLESRKLEIKAKKNTSGHPRCSIAL